MELDHFKKAIFSNNEQFVSEIVEHLKTSLDMRAVVGNGYGLSKEIDCKFDILLQHSNGLPEYNVYSIRDESIDGLDDFSFPIKVEYEDSIDITLEEGLSNPQQHQMQNTIHVSQNNT